MKKLTIVLIFVLAFEKSFGSNEAVFDPYNGRVLSYQELSAANVAISDYYRRVVSKRYDLYSENGTLKINILFANEISGRTCVLVMSARDDIRGGAGEYCIDNKTRKVLSFRRTK